MGILDDLRMQAARGGYGMPWGGGISPYRGDYLGIGNPQNRINQAFYNFPPDLTPQQRVDQGFSQDFGPSPQERINSAFGAFAPPAPEAQPEATGGMPVSLAAPMSGGGQSPLPPNPFNQLSGGGLNGDVLLALAGGFLSGNPGAGFTPAAQISARQRELEQKRFDENQTKGSLYDAAIKAGATPAQATAYARAPTETLALTPKPIEAGQDLLGQKYFVQQKPFGSGLVPAQVGGGEGSGFPGTGAGGPSEELLNKIVAARDSGVSREELLKMIPSSFRDAVGATLEGNSIPQNFGRGNARQGLLLFSHAVDKDFNENQIEGRKAFARQMQSPNLNSYGSQVRGSGTIVEHLGDANGYLKTLEKGLLAPVDRGSLINPATQFIRGQIGDPAIREAQGGWDTVRKGLAGEMERLLSGSHGAEASKEYWLDKLDLSHGPAYVRGSLNEIKNLMQGRLNNVALQKEAAYGGTVDPMSLFDAKQRKIMQQLEADLSTSGQQSAPTAAAQGAAQAGVFFERGPNGKPRRVIQQ